MMQYKMLAMVWGASFVPCSAGFAVVQKLNEVGAKVGAEELGTHIYKSVKELQKVNCETDLSQVYVALKGFEEYSSYFPRLADCGALEANGDRDSVYRQVMILRRLLCHPYTSETPSMEEQRNEVIISRWMIENCLNCLEKEESTITRSEQQSKTVKKPRRRVNRKAAQSKNHQKLKERREEVRPQNETGQHAD